MGPCNRVVRRAPNKKPRDGFAFAGYNVGNCSMARILVATSNGGKLRDFAAAAAQCSVEVKAVPDFKNLPEVVEDAPTFETNAQKKAEHYSRFAPGEYVMADDS